MCVGGEKHSVIELNSQTFFLLFFFSSKVSYNPGWLQNPGPPVSTFPTLGLQAYHLSSPLQMDTRDLTQSSQLYGKHFTYQAISPAKLHLFVLLRYSGVSVRVCMYTHLWMWMSENNFLESVLTFHLIFEAISLLFMPHAA